MRGTAESTSRVVAAAVDVDALYAALDQKRKQEGLSWRRLAEITDTSASTFTRMAQGHRPDVETFLTLCSWLGVPAEQFRRGDGFEGDRDNTLAAVTAIFRASPNLSPESARAMEEITRAAYERLKDM
jgi:transcriptional regulator with XRE-family HTH domain